MSPRRRYGTPDPKPRKPKPVYTPVSSLEQRALMALGRVSFPPATVSKRFAREMQLAKELTEKQRKFLWRIVYHFRRQVHDADVLEEMQRLQEWANTREEAAAVNARPEPAVAPPRDEPTPEEDAALPSLFDDWESA